MLKIIWISSFCFLVSSFCFADWPGFRGPHGLGISSGQAPPITWDAAKNIAWKTRLPGPGASSPIVWKDRVFVTCYSGYGLSKGEGKSENLRRHLLCLEEKTGRILWRKDVPAKFPETPYGGFITEHGYASSTPVTDGERVYVFFGRSGVLAFDFAGQQLWHSDVGRHISAWGSSASPLFYKNFVLVCAGVESDALIALDKHSGKEIWRAKAIGNTWATPLLVPLPDGKHEVVLNLEATLVGIHPANGQQLWQCEGVSNWPASTPVADKGVVYAMGGGMEGQGIMAVRAGGRGDVTNSHVLWKKKGGAGVCSPLLIDGRLIWVNGQLEAINTLSGDSVLRKRLYEGKMEYLSPVRAGNNVYAFTRRHGAFVLSVKDSFAQLAHNQLGETSLFNASPALGNGKLFVRSNQYIYCIATPKPEN